MEGLRQIAISNKRLGLETDVVTFDPPDARYLEGNAFRAFPLGRGALGYGLHPKAIGWLRRNAANYDAVVVNGLWQFHGLSAWIALRGSRTPYFVFTHGMLDPWFKRTYPLKHLKKLIYWTLVERRLLRDARAVLFTCEEERILARESFPFYKVREVVTGYGTSPPEDHPQDSIDAFHAAHPALRGRRLVLFIGRLHEKKGCDLLVSAFARVCERDPALHLVMAGPGGTPYEESLRSQVADLGIGDRVTWIGMISGVAKWGALRAAEITCLPSHQENFGITVAESLACGTPVAISNKVNIWREIEADRAGWVDEDNVDGTARCLSRWLDCAPAEFEGMRERARQCFDEHFRIEGASLRLLNLVHEELSAPPLRPNARRPS